jgi:nicotinate-nucleotide--dimethylbenzimidazole phosphoribosyltransferase
VRAQAALGTNAIGFGEMGIANSSAAACLMSRYCALPIARCVGRGTGWNDEGVARKCATLAAALARHGPGDALDTLAVFGGFEIAMMTGAYLAAAAAARMVIVVDGFIAGAALLAACALAPQVRDYCVFAHCSDEAGHAAMLAHFGAEPLLALALPLVSTSAAFLSEMASFASAGVSARE